MIFKPNDENKFAFKKYYSRGQRTYLERVRRRALLRRAIFLALFVFVFFLGFFVMSLLLNISSLPPA